MNTGATRAARSPVTLTLIAACAAAFVAQILLGPVLLEQFALWPPGRHRIALESGQVLALPPFQLWQLLSYGFLHGSPMHLALNLFGLWMFGRPVEAVLGPRRYLSYWLLCLLGAAAAQLLVAAMGADPRPTIGASGGVFGLLPAFALFFPQARIQLLFPPVSLRAPVFVLIYGAVEFFFGISDSLPGIAHFAHLGGMFCGLAVLLWWWSRARGGPTQPTP